MYNLHQTTTDRIVTIDNTYIVRANAVNALVDLSDEDGDCVMIYLNSGQRITVQYTNLDEMRHLFFGAGH